MLLIAPLRGVLGVLVIFGVLICGFELSLGRGEMSG